MACRVHAGDLGQPLTDQDWSPLSLSWPLPLCVKSEHWPATVWLLNHALQSQGELAVLAPGWAWARGYYTVTSGALSKDAGIWHYSDGTG